MPCRDGGPDPEQELLEDLNFYRAAFCGLMTMMEETIGSEATFAKLQHDFPNGATGVSIAELFERWNEHKKEDARRALYEAEEAEREKARKSALKKLTKKERRLLGIE